MLFTFLKTGVSWVEGGCSVYRCTCSNGVDVMEVSVPQLEKGTFRARNQPGWWEAGCFLEDDLVYTCSRYLVFRSETQMGFFLCVCALLLCVDISENKSNINFECVLSYRWDTVPSVRLGLIVMKCNHMNSSLFPSCFPLFSRNCADVCDCNRGSSLFTDFHGLVCRQQHQTGDCPAVLLPLNFPLNTCFLPV